MYIVYTYIYIYIYIYIYDYNALIIRLYIVIDLVVSTWKYYNLFIRVSDKIMVIYACIAVI